jgi:uncharacterized protein (TIGR02246 family)
LESAVQHNLRAQLKQDQMFETLLKTIAEQDERVIHSVMNEVVSAFNRNDLELLLSLHTDDVIIMEPGMPLIRGKQEFRRFLAGFQQQHIAIKLRFETRELEIIQDRAFVRGVVIKRTLRAGAFPKEEKGKFICLLKKQPDGEWLRTHMIVNNDQ